MSQTFDQRVITELADAPKWRYPFRQLKYVTNQWIDPTDRTKTLSALPNTPVYGSLDLPNNNELKTNSARHSAVYWDSLSVRVIPQGGVAGSAVDIYLSFTHSNKANFDTVDKILATPAEFHRQTMVGGASDPNMTGFTLACPFTNNVSKLVKPLPYYGGQPQIDYVFNQTQWGTVTNKFANLFLIEVTGYYYGVEQDLPGA